MAALKSGAYGLRARRGRHVLLERGRPTDDNATVIDWLEHVDPQEE